MFSKVFKKIVYLLKILFILIYLVLEELVWEQFAEPIYKYLKHLRIFKRLKILINSFDRYIVLLIFIFPFVLGEIMGILSPIMIVKGYLFIGIILYLLKLIIVAFAFWLFNIARKKLLSFWIIDYSYQKIIVFTNWIKSTQTFQIVTKELKKIKEYIKYNYKLLKAKVLEIIRKISK